MRNSKSLISPKGKTYKIEKSSVNSSHYVFKVKLGVRFGVAPPILSNRRDFLLRLCLSKRFLTKRYHRELDETVPSLAGVDFRGTDFPPIIVMDCRNGVIFLVRDAARQE